MKRLIFTILFGNSLLIYSQSILYPTNTIDWGRYDNSNETKQLLISEINKSLGNPEGTLPGHRARGTLFNYNVFDITEDGLLDIIYSGPSGEGSAVILFENRNARFIESDVIYGELTGLKRLGLSRTIEIQTHAYPCCAGVLHTLRTVVVNSNPDELEVITLSQFDYVDATADLIQGMTPIVFETINPEYKLRTTPGILTEYDLGIETIDGGNTVAIYPKGSIGKAVGKSTDETGRVWWLVIMQNNINPLKTLMYYQNDPKASQSIGWMSSNFVKELKSR
ncbi:MAG: hypothetical protein ABJG41_03785 [Cyclobacteriaceae bacterium]